MSKFTVIISKFQLYSYFPPKMLLLFCHKKFDNYGKNAISSRAIRNNKRAKSNGKVPKNAAKQFHCCDYAAKT